VFGVVSADSGTLWVADFGGDSINLWSIDDGQMAGSVRTGHAPDALAFSADEHLLLAVDARSGDVSVVRTMDKNGPTLFTICRRAARPRDCGEGDAREILKRNAGGTEVPPLQDVD